MTKINVIAPAEITVVPLSQNDSFRVRSAQWVATTTRRYNRWWTVERMLLAVWLFQGVVPLVLQTRTYIDFVKPHRIAEILVVPPDQRKETEKILEKCPMDSFYLAGVWWNHDTTHYYTMGNTTVCHIIVPQYNTHGNYVIHYAPPNSSTSSCVPVEVYLYHASIGFYSFYEREVGTYCPENRMGSLVLEVVGAYDINGSLLAEDTGSTKPRVSYWYSVVGFVWLAYRALIIRRSYILCRRYGQRCDSMGEIVRQHEIIVFVQESIRLSAHGATNCQRAVLLYIIVEGVMSDLFLIIAFGGWSIKIQYVSLGYNLSGLMLVLFEIIEHSQWLQEKWRLRIKRLFFSYETAIIGELVVAVMFQAFLSQFNNSDLKRSNPTALAVSYYLWSVICHAVVVVIIIAIILSVRMPIAILYVWLKHRSLMIFSAPCCVDTAMGSRSRLTMLGGYCIRNSNLYYTKEALKAFGMLKMEEDGAEYLVMRRLYWFAVPKDNLIVIGVVYGRWVEPCNERSCTGTIKFIERKLGGTSRSITCRLHRNIGSAKVMAWSGPDDGVLPAPVRPVFPLQPGTETA